MSKFKEASDCFEQVIAKDPNEVATLVNLASTYERQGQGDKAIELYVKATTLDKSNPHAFNGLGIALKKKKEYS